MPTPIVECIANYSDARRPQVIESIIQSIVTVEGVTLLDRHSDTDHNRTVLTYLGPPEPVSEAALRSIAKAAELINLDEHRGEHPRLGAADVVPFVPISGLSMQDSVQLARNLGKRVGEELQIPVYLYEEAATRPDRKNLEDIRRGQYELLKEEIQTNPNRIPDFGPTRVGTAGAVIIGARQPLIAFNVYLTTDDVSIADKIARAVRNSSGGLRFVKALGLLVEGRAQVSMNLTNYKKTPVARVVEMIRREAERYAVAIHHSELVGLIPQDALVNAAIWHLQLDQFEPEQILEQRIFAALQAKPVEEKHKIEGEEFLDSLAQGTATPGGGSASAYAAAAAAALVCMVARLTVGKKKYADVEAQMWSTIDQAEALRAELTSSVEKDSAAFLDVMAAFKLPKDTPEQETSRNLAIEAATLVASQIPLEVARKTVQVMELAAVVVQYGNVNALSDGGSGTALARAALTGAGMNVRINAKTLQDQAAAQVLINELRDLEARASQIEGHILALIEERGGFALH
jgi:glutamate formiminotransferase/formiminotetrahydrofolate cyclodeaminase